MGSEWDVKEGVVREQHMSQARAFEYGIIKHSNWSILLILFNLFSHCNFVRGKGAFSWQRREELVHS